MNVLLWPPQLNQMPFARSHEPNHQITHTLRSGLATAGLPECGTMAQWAWLKCYGSILYLHMSGEWSTLFHHPTCEGPNPTV